MGIDLLVFFTYLLDMELHEDYESPKIVTEYVNGMLDGLNESGFFIEHGINDVTYARKKLTSLLIDEYVKNPLLDDDEFFWTEDEFESILQKIIVGSILYELKEDGVLNSYEDDSTEETFFLTEKGKKLTQQK